MLELADQMLEESATQYIQSIASLTRSAAVESIDVTVGQGSY